MGFRQKLKFLKIFFIFVVASNALNALEITVNYGKENSKNFAVLNIKNEKPFLCVQKSGYNDEASQIECIIEATPKMGFTPIKTVFFDFKYKMIEKKFHLFITPRKKQKLFSFPQDYKENITIFKEKPALSVLWEIVGYEDQIPFLSNKVSRGLNFPVLIEEAQTPYVPELDISNKPLEPFKGLDFKGYAKTKELIQKKSYYQALTTIAQTIKQFPNTIFIKDLYLYQIIALSHISDPNKQDSIIEISQTWIRQYASDPQMPQVLYLLANAYVKASNKQEANHYYKQIIEEYSQSRFAALAKAKLAVGFANTSNTGVALIYFQEAYTQAKDLESASEIALKWAEFEILKQNNTNAIELINKILQAYPQFFIQDLDETYKTINFLANNKLYKSASDIGQYLITHTDKEPIREQVYYKMGELYEKDGKFDSAHKANVDFIATYPLNPDTKLIKVRDDNIIFQVSGNDEEKFKRYDYIIKKYPQTDQQEKALKLKAELLLKQKRYQEVLNLRKALGEKSLFIQKSLNSLIKMYLEQNDCKSTNIYLLQTSDYELSEDEKLKAFDCLYQGSLNKNAQIISTQMLKSSKTLNKKLAWLYRDAKNLYQLGDYKSSLLSSRDVFSLALSSNQKQYKDIGFTLFSNLAHIGNKDEAFKIFAQLDEIFKDDKQMIFVYAKLLEWQIDANTSQKNETTLQIYAKKIIDLQKKYKSDEFSPYAEFALINSFTQTNKLQEALSQINGLLKNNLSKEDRQKAFYLQGNIKNLEHNIKEAKQSFEACIAIETNSAWQNLCKQGLKLLEQ